MSKTDRGLKRLYRPLIVTALVFGGSFNLITAVLADGTSAGQTISNTATATYTDPDDKILTTTSNTVEVTVAEVAGITITNTDIRNTLESDGSPGDSQFEPGDTLVYEFEIRNVGNDATALSLTDVVGSSGPIENILSVSYDSDGDGAVDTTVTGRTEIQSVLVDETVVVEVTVKVDDNALLGDDITITLGDTPGEGQNQPYDASANSIFTVDNTTAEPGEADPTQPPSNGEREASSSGTIELGGQPTPMQPLVTILKSVSSVTDTGVANDVNDDTVSYTLTVDMQDTAPVGSDVIPSDLAPLSIMVNAAEEQHVLISDAIPVGTQLAAEPTGVPTGWTPVYTATPIATDAHSADWTTTLPAGGLPAVTRVGFILTADTALSKTAPNVNFTIDILNTAANTSNEIANIAQVFGAAEPDDPGTPGVDESFNHPVIDESGDTTPSNYDEPTGTYGGVDPENPGINGIPPAGFDPDDGQVDDPTALTPTDIDGGGATPGDPNDDHTGTPNDGPGEPVVVNLVPPTASDVSNGPNGQPDAIGPTDNNDDFTNKSTPGGPGVDPDPVGFTNTVANNSTVEGDIQLVLDPASTTLTDPTYLPTGTEVTIVLLDGTTAPFVLGADGDWDNPDGTPATFPIIQDLPAGQTQGYSVEVDLPNDSTVDLEDYPVVIDARLDTTDDGTFDDGTNKTIDRTYTGFLALTKSATIAQGDGPAVTGSGPAPGNHIVYTLNYNNISDTQTGSMTGNVLLTASDLEIFEDGTLGFCEADGTGANPSGLNNWAIDNQDEDGDGFYTTGIDTSHVMSSVDVVSGLDTGSSGNVRFFNGVIDCTDPDSFDYNAATDIPETSGTSTSNDVTRYLFEINGDIEPGETGDVEFRRRVN